MEPSYINYKAHGFFTHVSKKVVPLIVDETCTKLKSTLSGKKSRVLMTKFLASD